MSFIQRLQITRGGLPVAPVEIADAVEQYAREWGRHGTLRFVPTLLKGRRPVTGTWRVELSLRDSDRRLEAFKTGKVATAPTEIVWLHEPDPSSPTGYRPYDLDQLGAAGVRAFLEKGNTWSGRGEYRSLEEQARKVLESDERNAERLRDQQMELNRYERRDERRWRFKLPFFPVAIELGTKGRSGPVQRDMPQPTSNAE